MVVSIILWCLAVAFHSNMHTIDNYSLQDEISPYLLENGDLLFFTGKTFGDMVIKWWTMSAFSHVGMVLKDEQNNTFLWECDAGSSFKEGPRVIPLEKKLKGRGYVGARLINKKVEYLQLLELIKKRINGKLNRDYFGWLRGNKKENTYFCSELIILTILDLFPNSNYFPKDPAYYSPETLTHDFWWLYSGMNSLVQGDK